MSSYAQKEEWKPLLRYANAYSASNLGNIMRTTGGQGARSGRVLKPSLSGGYWQVNLYQKGEHEKVTIHSLVAEAFYGSCPEDKEVNHLNGIKTDNRIENLEYITHSQNVKHAYDTGLAKPKNGELNGRAKIKDSEVASVAVLRKQGLTMREIGAIIGLSESGVRNLIRYRLNGESHE